MPAFHFRAWKWSDTGQSISPLNSFPTFLSGFHGRGVGGEHFAELPALRELIGIEDKMVRARFTGDILTLLTRARYFLYPLRAADMANVQTAACRFHSTAHVSNGFPTSVNTGREATIMRRYASFAFNFPRPAHRKSRAFSGLLPVPSGPFPQFCARLWQNCQSLTSRKSLYRCPRSPQVATKALADNAHFVQLMQPIRGYKKPNRPACAASMVSTFCRGRLNRLTIDRRRQLIERHLNHREASHRLSPPRI